MATRLKKALSHSPKAYKIGKKKFENFKKIQLTIANSATSKNLLSIDPEENKHAVTNFSDKAVGTPNYINNQHYSEIIPGKIYLSLAIPSISSPIHVLGSRALKNSKGDYLVKSLCSPLYTPRKKFKTVISGNKIKIL